MVLPIVIIGDPVLRQRAVDLQPEHPALSQFIADMFDTMYGADGVGLAAPQVGASIRLFVVDAMALAQNKGPDGEPLSESEQAYLKQFKRVFINPDIYEQQGTPWSFEEGCLSIPGIREPVERQPSLRMRWVDENFATHDECFTGLAARVVQHEYDHLEGKLFVDYASPLKKQLLRPKLDRLSRGQTDADYPVKFYRRKASK